VAPLIDRDKLARHRQSRQGRRDKVLAAARELLVQVSYGRLTLDVVGQRAGLRQGATGMFFPSRESLALEVLELELAEWYQGLADRLEQWDEPTLDVDAVVELLTGSVRSRQVLARLLGLLPTIAEEDAGPLALYRLESFRHRWMLRLGAALEQRCPWLERGAGAVLIRRLQLVVAALHASANPATMTSAALDTPELAGLQADPSRELESLTRLLVEGHRGQGGP
jgi:AcrR family transcriptional regulator